MPANDDPSAMTVLFKTFQRETLSLAEYKCQDGENQQKNREKNRVVDIDCNRDSDAESLLLYRLATIVLQDAGCTIVDLPEEREKRGRGLGKTVAIATKRSTCDVKAQKAP